MEEENMLRNLRSSDAMAQLRAFVPQLKNTSHKGSSGKLGVIGGSLEYTGAPYFAAITALRVGADLSHVFCTPAAATPIKSYSPEIIVHPLLPTFDQPNLSSTAFNAIVGWLPSLTALVVGPGLGRDEVALECAKGVIGEAMIRELPIVVDGDGISHIVCKQPTIFKDYPWAVLTPNFPEYQRLCKSVGCKEDVDITVLSKALGNVTIVQKGSVDRISNGTLVLECKEEGSPRRCGGQGDILSGAVATFLTWGHRHQPKESIEYPVTMLAGYAGCNLTRICNKAAFAKHKRGTVTSDMIAEIPDMFAKAFESAC